LSNSNLWESERIEGRERVKTEDDERKEVTGGRKVGRW